MARMNLTEEDKGKPVVNSDGDEIGMVSDIKGGAAYVNPDPGLSDSIRSKLGWGDSDEGDYLLEMNRISTVTDDEVRLKQ